MPTHRRIQRSKGDSARQAFRDEMRATLAAVKEEEEFAAETAPDPVATREELAKRFPAVSGRNAVG